MKDKKDLNYIAAVEKAIEKKYGKEAIQNPKGNWDEKKEKEYLKQIKELAEKERKAKESSEKIDVNGILVSKKLLNKESGGSCPICERYLLVAKDDICMTKFNCCFQCYVKWVEDREERWMEGWRPNED
jgi:hypothetical protein